MNLTKHSVQTTSDKSKDRSDLLICELSCGSISTCESTDSRCDHNDDKLLPWEEDAEVLIQDQGLL